MDPFGISVSKSFFVLGISKFLSSNYFSLFRFPSLELFPEPYYIWKFDESLDDWANDVTNWDLKWELIDGSVCLQNVPFKPKTPSKRKPWVNSKAKEVKTAKVTKASFWSPPLSQDSGMRCLTMEYRISQGTETSQVFSLAMLQQQDGWLVIFNQCHICASPEFYCGLCLWIWIPIFSFQFRDFRSSFSYFNYLFDNNKHIDVKVSLIDTFPPSLISSPVLFP